MQLQSNLFFRLYERTLQLASHRHAVVYLGIMSFLESIIVPIPPDAMLIPMVLANKIKAWNFALVTTITSVLGGIGGYFIGAYLYDTVGHWLVELYGLQSYFEILQSWYIDYGIWIVLISGFLPIPYKVFTIASGLFSMALVPFIICSLIGRSARFFAVSAVCYWVGDSIYLIMKRYASKSVLVLTLVLVGVFIYWTVR